VVEKSEEDKDEKKASGTLTSTGRLGEVFNESL